MSDAAQGPGWWQASDGRWYPPETLAQAMAQAAAQPAPEAAPEPVPEEPPAPGPAAGGAEGPGGPLHAPQVPGYPAYGPPPYAPAVHPEAPYPWPPQAAYPAWGRTRAIGALIVLLGLAGVVWGIGELFAAMALNSSPVYPHDEQVGAWILTAGILLASLVTIVIGFVYRRQ